MPHGWNGDDRGEGDECRRNERESDERPAQHGKRGIGARSDPPVPLTWLGDCYSLGDLSAMKIVLSPRRTSNSTLLPFSIFLIAFP